MEAIGTLLPQIGSVKGKKTNKFFLMAEEITKITGEPVTRRLREVKQNQWAAETALRKLKERIKEFGKPSNPAAYYTSLYRKFKENGQC